MSWYPGRLWPATSPSASSDPLDGQPIHGELFSVERLEQHGETLAGEVHASISRVNSRRLKARVADNDRVLRAAYVATMASVRQGHAITPAASWLVDNFYLVEEQVRTIRSSLPPGFHRRLPKVTDGAFKGTPRVLALAWAYVAHTDSSFDPLVLARFINAYQRVQPLQICELWALATTLPVVLVENLRRLSTIIVDDAAAREAANTLADRLLGAGGHEAEPAGAVLPTVQLPLPVAFVVQLVRRLREEAPCVAPTLAWLDRSVAAEHTNTDALVAQEHLRQGAANVTIRNIIVSMRLLAAIDWRDLFETVCLVDAKLAAGSNFLELDLPTRQLYRDAVEKLSRGSRHSEIDVAERALRAAAQPIPAGDAASTARLRDPGYFLIDGGRADFERTLGYHGTFQGWLARANKALGISGYMGIVLLLTLAVTAGMVKSVAEGSSDWVFWLLAVLALIPASDAAITLVNLGATHRFDSTILPGLELAEGVPAELRTMVVIPTLLTSADAIAEQVKRLEVHHLANNDGDLTFALLSDWTDSATEHAADDEALLRCAVDAMAVLNKRHGPGPSGDRFLLLHRNRYWNEAQGRWMGWERKRGKLHEFNRLLRGATDTGFVATGGLALRVPPNVRYVIALDGDNRLPRGSVVRMIGKMAHPLNRPTLDPSSGRIVSGYAVLQPRVSPALPTDDEGSLFQRVFASTSGMDPYAAAVSDVYQDLYGEGSYCGKGIYDVDAFEAALVDRFPDNFLLSHDLVEGIFARAGLVSDIEIIDEFPTRYDVAASRHYRWARGDWQLLPWILGLGGKTEAERQKQAVPLVGRWKMIDNLRRSLSAPASVLALLAGWVLPRVWAGRWTLFIVAVIALPAVIPFVGMIIPRQFGLSMRMHAMAVLRDLRLAVTQTLLLVSFLADQAWSMSDAILRTMVRLLVTRANLLEWTTAAQVQSGPALDIAGLYRHMAGSVGLAVVATALVAGLAPAHLLVAAPLLLLWLAAPLIARWISLPRSEPFCAPLNEKDTQDLRLIARRTWSFFETFVTAADHNLPPDNFQEDPAPVVAHRTSPTNLGLYLLSVVSAVDFGWIGLIEATDRLEATLASMGAMERHLGHFYNWYGTQDLRPLEPKYISAVDSGNLAGHLVVLWNACAEMLNNPLIGQVWPDGVGDVAALIGECQVEAAADADTTAVHDALALFAAALPHRPSAPLAHAAGLRDLAECAGTIRALIDRQASGHKPSAVVEAARWAATLELCIAGHQACVDRLLPWAARTDLDAEVAALFIETPSLADLPRLCRAAVAILSVAPTADHQALIASFEQAGQEAATLGGRITAIATKARQLFDAMSFRFLFDAQRDLMSIGYRVSDGTLDSNYYDLLASEARLASFVGIAKGDLPTRHWFRLGRAMAPVGYGAALISWSGSMFEYLMPSLVMRGPQGSLLEQTSQEIVRQQMAFGASRSVPWGVSESAYNARDLELTYQYSSFGIPSVGLKRGLGAETVIAPYATALAAMVAPQEAVRNFRLLTKLGGRGRYGWYEALDYTKARLPRGSKVAIVKAYMAHHQGMSVVAIADAVHGGAMRERFHNEPMIEATELLLQERMPHEVATFAPLGESVTSVAEPETLSNATQRLPISPNSATPATQLLSNGVYSVMLTAAGSGYSRWDEMAVTRWKEDATCDPWGSYVFLRDVQSGKTWSAGYQPTGVAADRYQAAFTEGRAEISRKDGSIATLLEVVVSSEDNAEVRRVSITNQDGRRREIEVTSYAEIVLAPSAADDAHPAFSKMFVQTELVEGMGALLATRRLRSPGDPEAWAAHLAVIEGESIGEMQYETDRARFLGRGRTIRAPAALDGVGPLSNTLGTVLDPVFSLRRLLIVPPRTTVRVAFWTLIASTRQELLDLIDRHHDPMAFDRATTLAWTQAQVQLRHLGIGFDEAHLFQQLANRMLFIDPTVRPKSASLTQGAGAVSLLWQQGISGDLPFLLLRVDHDSDLTLVRQVLLAHEYWQMKRLEVDVVILNDRRSSYAQEFQTSLTTLVAADRALQKSACRSGCGAVFVLRSDLISPEVSDMLQSSARMLLIGYRGGLAEQLARVAEPLPLLPPRRFMSSGPGLFAAPARPVLEFDNGTGGFADEGREYVVTLGEGHWTPAPWINVVANSGFGFQASAEGSSMTWSASSQQNLLTPWSNDPVADAPGEVIYVRDDDSGEVWGPTALPMREAGSTYTARFGQGYCCFEHQAHGILLKLQQFVPLDDSIKISRLTVTDVSGRNRRLSVTAYVEWVLGPSRGAAQAHVITEIDPKTGAMLARNKWSAVFGNRVAFADLGGRQTSWTGDRREFLGRNGALDRPLALNGEAPLSMQVGAGLDPCCALQTKVRLAAGASVEILFLLGQSASQAEALALVAEYRQIDLDTVFESVKRFWDDTLSAVTVTTPDRSMDIMLNRWLLYQTLVCRVWARSGFYQSSGAYGFRDQLQDGMALCVAQPTETRAHLLRAASRQFVEGDVQHWWLPETGMGVRTLVSDDRIWLPHTVAYYVAATGDSGVLDELVPYLEGPVLKPGEAEAYFGPTISGEQATLFEHCALALDQSLAVGAHGLPLIGSGDWNDGMNRVGAGGKGESIWLGWFLHATLLSFAKLADTHNAQPRATHWRAHAAGLALALERDGWDGDWYRRAYFDDGTPLGSATDTECRIDSIAQSWGVISGAAEPARAKQAMAAVDRDLVRRDDALVLLFTPPFDKTPLDPGYIKGYPPGLRENGGQYTHAAVWSVIAYAMLGNGDKAHELFSMLNPIHHADTPDAVRRYRVEPYVACADVYSTPPHVGRGGWTWYTGSAGWMYRAGLESILGFQVQGDELHIAPCIPATWPGFSIAFRHHTSRYTITVENPDRIGRGIQRIELDGVALAGELPVVKLVDNGSIHTVRVVLG